MSEMQTTICSLEVARRAAQELGIPVGTAGKVSSFYEGQVDCQLRFGDPSALMDGYCVGLRKQKDGTYSLVSDVYDIADKPMLKRFGENYDSWKTVTKGATTGHMNDGKPNRFLQAYNLQAAELGAKAKGCRFVRLKQGNGDVYLRCEGGPIPRGAYIQVEARADGSCRVTAHGIKGKGCVMAGDWARKVVGSIQSTRYTKEYLEAQQQQAQNQEAGCY